MPAESVFWNHIWSNQEKSEVNKDKKEGVRKRAPFFVTTDHWIEDRGFGD